MTPLESTFPDVEASFYLGYPWCLNAFPTIQEVVQHLRRELSRVHEVNEDWHRAEVMTNVFLLSCAIADTVDDYLLGDRYDFAKATKAVRAIGPVVRSVEGLLTARQKYREWTLRPLRRWRERWGAATEEFLTLAACEGRPDRGALSAPRARLASLLTADLPGDLRRLRPRLPGAFRKQDLTHLDILALGRKFVTESPDRGAPIAVVGLRTAGSYFAPLLTAYLRTQGYGDVDAVTMRPKRGLALWEAARLGRCASRGGLALLVDEPVDSGATLAKAIALLKKAGIAGRNVVALVPVHPTRRDWTGGGETPPIADIRVLRLEPEEWHKQQLLHPDAVEARLQEYFQGRKYLSARVVASPKADRFNVELEEASEQKFGTRLKRVYEVQLEDPTGRSETRYVLVKSVGWGWLGYHAFIAADELSGFVPPVLGLRDGILYTEWLPQDRPAVLRPDRDLVIRSGASYVAARVRSMRLGSDPAPDLSRQSYHKGYEMLAAALSQAYGWKPTAALRCGRIRHELSRGACPFPTLIDGRMRSEKWIGGPGSLLKTDFEHHGLGKSELNVTDPAYDLADFILWFRLSRGEERALLDRYIQESGDRGVEGRLFLSKLMAGIAAMRASLANLEDPRLVQRHGEFNRRYIEAWNFLTVQTVRFCASFCRKPAALRWRTPLVVLDIDGVVDRRLLGFPSTTAAGIHALSLLHAHDFAVAVNTARTLAEVKEYCEAYGCVGGVAEYGSVIWDAVGGRARVLVGSESLSQLEQVRRALQRIPGVFQNDDYQYSIRAYTYERGATAPLPTTLIRNLMADLSVDRLTFSQGRIETAVLARETDKGWGLLALLEAGGQTRLETLAVGDSEADLAMFRVAARCFAPSQISCAPAARMLGCHIVRGAYQRGLLEAVRLMVHPGGDRCDRCRSADPLPPGNLFLELLDAADQNPPGLLLRALLDPMALRAFVLAD